MTRSRPKNNRVDAGILEGHVPHYLNCDAGSKIHPSATGMYRLGRQPARVYERSEVHFMPRSPSTRVGEARQPRRNDYHTTVGKVVVRRLFACLDQNRRRR